MHLRSLFFICLTFQTIYAKTDEEVRSWYISQAMDCNKEHPVSQEEITMLQKHKLPESKNAKCLLACVFKKANFLDDKGMFDQASATAKSAKDHEGNEMKVENSKKLMDICKKVNDQEVSDGEAGCDRAVLLVKCFKENGPGLGLPVHPHA